MVRKYGHADISRGAARRIFWNGAKGALGCPKGVYGVALSECEQHGHKYAPIRVNASVQ